MSTTETNETDEPRKKKKKKLGGNSKLLKASIPESKSEKIKKKKKHRDTDDGGNDDDAGEGGSGRKLKKNDNQRKGGVTAFVDDYNDLMARKQEISDEVKVLMATAKAEGFVPKAIKDAAKRARNDANEEHKEYEALVSSYLAVMGVR